MSASSGKSRPCMGIPGGVIALLLILSGIISACDGGLVPQQESSDHATAIAKTQALQTQTVATARAQSNSTATAQAQLNATATAHAQTATATAVPSVMITSPKNNATVGSFITVQGSASNIPSGKELWLFVTEEGISGYYPQLVGGDPANPRPITISNGTWSIGAHFGNDIDPNAIDKTFTLILTLVDQNDSSAHQAIIAYFQPSNQYMPIQTLPGAAVGQQVQVVRTQ